MRQPGSLPRRLALELSNAARDKPDAVSELGRVVHEADVRRQTPASSRMPRRPSRGVVVERRRRVYVVQPLPRCPKVVNRADA